MNIIGKYKRAIKLVFLNPARIALEIYWKICTKFNIRLSSFPFISGDTFRSISNFVWEDGGKGFDPSLIKKGDIVFCEAHLAESFGNQVLRYLTVPIVVIYGNSDFNHTELTSKHFISEFTPVVFAQNLVEEIERFDILPIGLENIWRLKNGKFLKSEVDNISTQNKKYRVLAAFNTKTNVQVRIPALSSLKDLKTVDFLGSIDYTTHRSIIREYAFVASPPGNGLDCHRTWEALYSKAIPIVMRSYLTERLESLGVPVWIVDTYDEIKFFDEKALRAKYEYKKSKFENPAIFAKFWLDMIHESSRNLKNS